MVVWNISIIQHLHENETAHEQGMNDFTVMITAVHIFKLNALDGLIDLPDGSMANQVEGMCGHILAYGELAKVYKTSSRRK